MNLLTEARSILDGAGYRTHLPKSSSDRLIFEDDTLIGFISVHSKVEEIVEKWQREQDAFLREHAPALRKEPNKAWNLYAVFLTSAPCPPALKKEITNVEEDFRSTRKIVGFEIETHIDLVRAVITLLPIQSQVVLQPQDLIARLRQIIEIPQLLEDQSLDEIFRMLTAPK